jgi:hypothetical protein
MCNGSKLDLGIYELKHECCTLAFKEPGLVKVGSFVVHYVQNCTDICTDFCFRWKVILALG